MIENLNLSSQPFRNRTLPWTLAVIIAAVSVAALVFTLGQYRGARARSLAVESQVRELRTEHDSLKRQAEEVNSRLTEDQRRTLDAAHLILDRKNFSWSRLFADLESTLPQSVRVSRITVRDISQAGGRTRADLELAVTARSAADVTRMMAQMVSSGIFAADLLTQMMRREDHAARGAKPGGQARQQLQERLARFRGARRTGMFGVPEIVALAASCLLLALAFAAYFLLLVPQRSGLVRSETERASLQGKILAARENVGARVSTNEAVSNIVRSIQSFETGTLAAREVGIMPIYEELNDKTRRNGLARAQFSFVHQEEAGAQQQAGSAANLAGSSQRRQLIFPAVDINLNIEGNYPNVRRFIADLERSNRFVVINGVQLEGINESGADPSTRGTLVSLRLDMSAYFRRAGQAGGAAGGARQ
ncbi:MAG: hypothetical protein LC800_20790 [Acidobacteria bacterium]|nr:hypothetical protein [Acidobacteriota bacterium]